MQEVRLRTSVETRDERHTLPLRDPALFSYPFLYMTGERGFPPFSDEDIVILRRYLLFGGLLLIDDARGTKGQDFDASVRRSSPCISRATLKILAPDHTVFRSFYLIRMVGGVRIINPYLEGVHLETALPFSTVRMAWGWRGNVIILATGCPCATRAEKRNAWRLSNSASTVSSTPDGELQTGPDPYTHYS
jgi:hypothetical protein